MADLDRGRFGGDSNRRKIRGGGNAVVRRPESYWFGCFSELDSAVRRARRRIGFGRLLDRHDRPSTQRVNSASTLAKMIECRPGPTTAVVASRW